MQILNQIRTYTFLLLLGLLIMGCKKERIENQDVKDTDESYPFKIVTNIMDFQCSDTLESGWQIIEYINNSPETHFVLFDKYPEGKSNEEITQIFQSGMDFIAKGEAETGFAEFGKLPAWFAEVVYTGGTGLIGPESTARSIIHLEPGHYYIECYVKMPNGKFHTTMGMFKALYVKNKKSSLIPPQPNVRLELSGEGGIEILDTVVRGRQIFKVHFKDQVVHENFVGHDINLARIDAGADVEILEEWMNWANPNGLISPAPDGFTFLGGVNDMPGESIGYFEADLSPGEYVLISEVPEARRKNMLKVFQVD